MGAPGWRWVLAMAAVAVGSCTGGDEPQPASVADAAQLAEMLDATFIGCHDPAPLDPLGDRPADGVDDPLPSAVSCSTAVGSALLFVYRDADDRAAALSNGEVQSAVGMCPSGEGDLGSVSADNWRIVVREARHAATVAHAMALGSREVLSCLMEH